MKIKRIARISGAIALVCTLGFGGYVVKSRDVRSFHGEYQREPNPESDGPDRQTVPVHSNGASSWQDGARY